MQANGADMLRLACCFATERGLKVCAPVHDAILIEFELEGEEQALGTIKEAMREASHFVLSGFELRTEALVIRHPDRYMDKRGQEMWDKVWRLIENLESPAEVTSQICVT